MLYDKMLYQRLVGNMHCTAKRSKIPRKYGLFRRFTDKTEVSAPASRHLKITLLAVNTKF